MGKFFGRQVTQVTLLLRLVCGGYLLYLAWGLREAVFGPERQLGFILAAAVFAVVGLLLCGFSLRGLIRREYENSDPDGEEEGSQDEETDSEK